MKHRVSLLASLASLLSLAFIPACSATDDSLSVDDSTAELSAAYPNFYGVNAHWEQGAASQSVSARTQLGYLRELGIKVMRQDVKDGTAAEGLAAWSVPLRNDGGILILPVILLNGYSLNNSEGNTYNYARNTATAVAKAWSVTGQHYYECGNELENNHVNGDGDQPSHYTEAFYVAYRGIVRGCIDGIRSVDKQALVAPSATSWLHFALDEMMMNGTDPDHNTGIPPVNFDFVPWHWYNDMGDIENAKGHNVLAHLHSWGKPIWMTEFGFRPNGKEQDQANFLASGLGMGKYYPNRAKYNIRNITVYELFNSVKNDPNYGLLETNGITKKPAYWSVQKFIQEHP